MRTCRLGLRRLEEEAAWIERYRQLRAERFDELDVVLEDMKQKEKVDARTGGSCRFVFSHPSMEQPMSFFGKYTEVTPHSRLVWTNEEGAEGGAVTTVTFEERGAETGVVMHDVHPSKGALDEAISSGSTSGFSETFEQLDAVLVG